MYVYMPNFREFIRERTDSDALLPADKLSELLTQDPRRGTVALEKKLERIYREMESKEISSGEKMKLQREKEHLTETVKNLLETLGDNRQNQTISLTLENILLGFGPATE